MRKVATASSWTTLPSWPAGLGPFGGASTAYTPLVRARLAPGARSKSTESRNDSTVPAVFCVRSFMRLPSRSGLGGAAGSSTVTARTTSNTSPGPANRTPPWSSPRTQAPAPGAAPGGVKEAMVTVLAAVAA